jgi:hypothetical protein
MGVANRKGVDRWGKKDGPANERMAKLAIAFKTTCTLELADSN